jgi:L-ascorbate metabolism protein UlaG (beta-lactamase superfamily)
LAITGNLVATWIGHSTVLMRFGPDFHVITDPVFSRRCGLYFGPTNIGPKRLAPPAIALRSLPKIDLILLSHAHMDHFDIPSLRRLESRGTHVVTAHRTSDLLRVKRYGKVSELKWNESVHAGPLRIRACEVRHWGARTITDVWRGYNGYTIEYDGGTRVLFGGDTAMTPAFRSLKSSKSYDLAIMPIGAYNPWIANHCSPEQAWRMGTDAGAEAFLPVHHQTFGLGREPFYEPIERFLEASRGDTRRVLTCKVGDVCAV